MKEDVDVPNVQIGWLHLIWFITDGRYFLGSRMGETAPQFYPATSHLNFACLAQKNLRIGCINLPTLS